MACHYCHLKVSGISTLSREISRATGVIDRGRCEIITMVRRRKKNERPQKEEAKNISENKAVLH